MKIVHHVQVNGCLGYKKIPFIAHFFYVKIKIKLFQLFPETFPTNRELPSTKKVDFFLKYARNFSYILTANEKLKITLDFMHLTVNKSFQQHNQ